MGCILKRCAHAGSSQQHWPFPESHIGLGYSYILTHPGLPCVAWEHMWDPRHTFIITQLMAMRRRQDIHAGSKLEILCADRMMYVARIDNRWVNRGWFHTCYCTQSMWFAAECARCHYSQLQCLCIGCIVRACECQNACTHCKCCTDVPCPQLMNVSSCLEYNEAAAFQARSLLLQLRMRVDVHQ